MIRRRHLLALVILLAACSGEHGAAPSEDEDAGEGEDESDTSTDAGKADPPDASEQLTGCPDQGTAEVPSSLACAGLYANLGEKVVATDAREFEPAYPLWSDGASKHRWIQLPKGKKINNAQPNAWVFPVGTKLWKEFLVGGKRIETRLLWKVEDGIWRKGTYVWNDAESEATSSVGKDIRVQGALYHLPTQQECEDCHGGQPDWVLGFSAVNLGFAAAKGLTLSKLWDLGLLTTKPPLLVLSIGADKTGLDDDGQPLAEKVLGAFHTNCGQSCHNPTTRAKGGLTNQDLRLDSAILDGRAPDQMFGAIATAINQRAEGTQWRNHPYRIIPGDPKNSLIYQLLNYRDPTGMGKGQMPPIASRKIDDVTVKLVEKWITRLK